MDEAFRRCANGMLAEIKYDGERVQLHKRGTEFVYFSRNLKPILVRLATTPSTRGSLSFDEIHSTQNIVSTVQFRRGTRFELIYSLVDECKMQ